MTIDLSNPAVSFLFFTGFGLWTLFVAWIHEGAENALTAWPKAVTLWIAAASTLTGLFALFIVVTNALIAP